MPAVRAAASPRQTQSFTVCADPKRGPRAMAQPDQRDPTSDAGPPPTPPPPPSAQGWRPSPPRCGTTAPGFPLPPRPENMDTAGPGVSSSIRGPIGPVPRRQFPGMCPMPEPRSSDNGAMVRSTACGRWRRGCRGATEVGPSAREGEVFGSARSCGLASSLDETTMDSAFPRRRSATWGWGGGGLIAGRPRQVHSLCPDPIRSFASTGWHARLAAAWNEAEMRDLRFSTQADVVPTRVASAIGRPHRWLTQRSTVGRHRPWSRRLVSERSHTARPQRADSRPSSARPPRAALEQAMRSHCSTRSLFRHRVYLPWPL